MLTKPVTYTDYNGVERTENFYFNLTEAEILEMQLSTTGGLAEMIQQVVDSNDQVAIIKIFKDLVLKAYGEKSADGKYFEKSQEISTRFSHSPAYSKIFMELATDADAAAAFVNGIVPAAMSKKLAEQGNAPAA